MDDMVVRCGMLAPRLVFNSFGLYPIASLSHRRSYKKSGVEAALKLNFIVVIGVSCSVVTGASIALGEKQARRTQSRRPIAIVGRGQGGK